MRLLILLTAFLLSVSSLFGAIEKDRISTVMKEKIDTVTLLLQDKKIAREALKAQIFAIFDPAFDYPLMARLSLGTQQWEALSKNEKQIFAEHFEKKLKNSYVEKLDLYTDEVVAIKEVKPVKSRMYLLTELIGKESNYQIDYKFYDGKKRGWLIYDVDILGVSIIQTYRSQFAGILNKISFEELIKLLDASEPAKQQ